MDRQPSVALGERGVEPGNPMEESGCSQCPIESIVARDWSRLGASVLGALLIALGAENIVYALSTQPLSQLGSYVAGAAIPAILGALLLWWGLRRPSPESANAPPSTFGTAAALAVGALLLLLGTFLGLIFALALGAAEGLQVAFIPWDTAGLVLVTYGIRRATSSAPRTRAATEARAILERVRSPSAGPGPLPAPPGVDRSSLLKMQGEILTTVRQAYRSTAPTIRLSLYAWLVLWTLFVAQALAYAANAFGVGLPFLGLPPHRFPLAYGVEALVFAGLGVLEVGVGVPARLRALARVEADLVAGRVPEFWVLIWWLPFVYTAHLLWGLVRGTPAAAPAPTESSVLATSYSLLRFGRGLATYARAWYTSIFVVLLLAAFPVFLVGDVLGITLAGGPAGAGLGWVAALAVLVVAFAYLYRRYRTLDPLAQRLAVLGVADAELDRAFWAQF
jgi:hypothetical protein